MKQYQLQADFQNYKKGDIFVGPIEIQGQSSTGYYPKGTESTAPGTQCVFQSFVESNPEIFKLVTE